MKIKCEPGVVVQVSKTGQTSIHGGEYTVDEKYGREALKKKGVTELKDTTAASKKSDNQGGE